jgi:plasmid stabilization system protein ParE
MEDEDFEFAPQADRDFDELFLWIMIDAGPNAAGAFARRIDRAVRNLARFPEMGRVRTELSGRPRSLSVNPWVIFYEPMEGRRGILVTRLVDGRRDIEDLLGGSDR